MLIVPTFSALFVKVCAFPMRRKHPLLSDFVDLDVEEIRDPFLQ